MYRKGFLIISVVTALFFITLSAITLTLKHKSSHLHAGDKVDANAFIENMVTDNHEQLFSDDNVVEAVASNNKIPKSILAKNDVDINIRQLHVTEEKKVRPAAFNKLTHRSKNKNLRKPIVIAEEKTKVVGDNLEKVKIIRKTPIAKNGVFHDFTKKRNYLPYLQFGGNIFINGPDTAAGGLDLFIPILQWDLTDLIFTDLRFYNRSGPAFEGNIHLGYRHLFLESQQLVGVFVAFDRRKTYAGNYFNQITLGAEYWLKRFFIGANAYAPLGTSMRHIGFGNSRTINNPASKESYSSITSTKDKLYEKAIAGFDAEVGYEFIDGLVGYFGGYYFNANRVNGVYGPKTRLTYDLSLDSKNVFKIFNKVGLEAGVQHDKQRGTVWNVGINLRIGPWSEKMKALEGVSRHMIDPVRRDVDIVVSELAEEIKVRALTVKQVTNLDEFYKALKDPKVDIVCVEFKLRKEEIDINKIDKAKTISPVIFVGDAIGHQDISTFLNDNTLNNVVPFSLNGNSGIDEGAFNLLSNKKYGYEVINRKKLISFISCYGGYIMLFPDGTQACDMNEDLEFMYDYHIINRSSSIWSQLGDS